MARLYRDPTLQHQIDLTLTRLILEGVNVSVHTLQYCIMYICICYTIGYS